MRTFKMLQFNTKSLTDMKQSLKKKKNSGGGGSTMSKDFLFLHFSSFS